jgi:hypothetical protein
VQAGFVQDDLAAEGLGDVGEVQHQRGRIAASCGHGDRRPATPGHADAAVPLGHPGCSCPDDGRSRP